MNALTLPARVKSTLACLVRRMTRWAWSEELAWWARMHAEACEIGTKRGNALHTAYRHIINHHACRDALEPGMMCPVCHHADDTEPEMDEIHRALFPPNTEIGE